MPTLASPHLSGLCAFAPYFSNRVWQHAPALLFGTILTIGQLTVATALRIVELSAERRFPTCRRLLNRAAWSNRALSRVLPGMLIVTFAAAGEVIAGPDDAIERRRGAKIRVKGIYHDPARSSMTATKESGTRCSVFAPLWSGGVLFQGVCGEVI